MLQERFTADASRLHGTTLQHTLLEAAARRSSVPVLRVSYGTILYNTYW